MKFKKAFDELTMFTGGAGLAMVGASMVIVGAQAVKKNFYYAGVVMAVGVASARVGSLVAIGAVERMTGKR